MNDKEIVKQALDEYARFWKKKNWESWMGKCDDETSTEWERLAKIAVRLAKEQGRKEGKQEFCKELEEILDKIASFEVKHTKEHMQTGRCTICSYNQGQVDLATEFKKDFLALKKKHGVE